MCPQNWASPGPTPACVHTGAHLRHAHLRPCRSSVRVSKCVCFSVDSGRWLHVESQKGTPFQVGSGLWALVARCTSLLPLHLLPPREGKQRRKDTCSYAHTCSILKVENQPHLPELRRLEGGRTSEIIQSKPDYLTKTESDKSNVTQLRTRSPHTGPGCSSLWKSLLMNAWLGARPFTQ